MKIIEEQRTNCLSFYKTTSDIFLLYLKTRELGLLDQKYCANPSLSYNKYHKEMSTNSTLNVVI